MLSEDGELVNYSIKQIYYEADNFTFNFFNNRGYC